MLITNKKSTSFLNAALLLLVSMPWANDGQAAEQSLVPISVGDILIFVPVETGSNNSGGTGTGTDPNVSDEADSDGDGVNDLADAFPIDPNESSDSDKDGVGDNADQFPNDRSEWADTDGDGTGDNSDPYPSDPVLAAYSSDGTSFIPVAVGDILIFLSSYPDSDGDGLTDDRDPDDDNDGVDDRIDVFGLDSTETSDADGDGIGDVADTDDDNDGMSDEWEIANNLNPLDAFDATGDLDDDGYTNLQEFEAVGKNSPTINYFLVEGNPSSEFIPVQLRPNTPITLVWDVSPDADRVKVWLNMLDPGLPDLEPGPIQVPPDTLGLNGEVLADASAVASWNVADRQYLTVIPQCHENFYKLSAISPAGKTVLQHIVKIVVDDYAADGGPNCNVPGIAVPQVPENGNPHVRIIEPLSNPVSVNSGSLTNLRWEGTDVLECRIHDGPDGLPPSGSTHIGPFGNVGSPAMTWVTVVECVGAGGWSYDSVVYDVNGGSSAWLDSDLDGMDDEWESLNGLNPRDGKDVGLDPDGDGFNNLEEYRNGTQPNEVENAITIRKELFGNIYSTVAMSTAKNLAQHKCTDVDGFVGFDQGGFTAFATVGFVYCFDVVGTQISQVVLSAIDTDSGYKSEEIVIPVIDPADVKLDTRDLLPVLPTGNFVLETSFRNEAGVEMDHVDIPFEVVRLLEFSAQGEDGIEKSVFDFGEDITLIARINDTGAFLAHLEKIEVHGPNGYITDLLSTAPGTYEYLVSVSDLTNGAQIDPGTYPLTLRGIVLNQEIYSEEFVITVKTNPNGGAVSMTGFDQQFEVYRGDFNSDRDIDYYVRRMPDANVNSVVPNFLLLGSRDGAFHLISDDGVDYSSHVSQTVPSLRATNIGFGNPFFELVIDDFNADGVGDLYLEEANTIVYANSDSDSLPVFKNLDARYATFFQQVAGVVDGNTFQSGGLNYVQSGRRIQGLVQSPFSIYTMPVSDGLSASAACLAAPGFLWVGYDAAPCLLFSSTSPDPRFYFDGVDWSVWPGTYQSPAVSDSLEIRIYGIEYEYQDLYAPIGNDVELLSNVFDLIYSGQDVLPGSPAASILNEVFSSELLGIEVDGSDFLASALPAVLIKIFNYEVRANNLTTAELPTIQDIADVLLGESEPALRGILRRVVRGGLFQIILGIPGSTVNSDIVVRPGVDVDSIEISESITSDNPDRFVNLDSGSPRALASGNPEAVATVAALIGDRKPLITSTAFNEVMQRVTAIQQIDRLALLRIAAVMSVVTRVPDNPSARVMALRPTRVVLLPDQIIFGTGDQHWTTTITSDARFPGAAAEQGVVLDVLIHPSWSF